MWLDAGIVPFSTLGWQNPEFIPEGYATGAARGLTKADLPDHAVLGGVVPRRLGDGDARADPAVVLLAALHVGRADRARAVPQGAHVREAARRRRARDARLVGQPDLRRGGVRAHGRRRHALAVLPAAADAEHPLRLRAGGRGQAPPADAVELGALLRRLRRDRGLPAALRGPRDGRHRRRAAAARRVAARAHEPAGRRGRGRLRGVPDGRRDQRASSPSSRTSRTGTSAARAGASTPSTRRRSGRCGRRSSSRCA